MIKTCLGVLLAFASLGCSSDSTPGANVAMDVTLADSPLARMQNVSLIRAGDSFTLAGYEDGLVRWGRLSPNTLDGQLAYETSFTLPGPLVGPAPVFAATMKVTPGDQLVAIGLTNSSTVSGGYNLSAIVQTMGDALPAAPVVLATIEAGIDPNTVQIVAGAATSGNVGFVAWGIPVKGRTVNYFLLTANAQHASALLHPQALGQVAGQVAPGPHALRRARAHHGIDFAIERVWVIGDTPHDIVCGQTFGARTLAVATGRYAVEELRAARPDAVFADLGDTAAFWQLLE